MLGRSSKATLRRFSGSFSPYNVEIKMETFTLYWLTGKREVVKGKDVAQAMTLAGYGGGSVSALDFYAYGNDKEYSWNAGKRNWVKK